MGKGLDERIPAEGFPVGIYILEEMAERSWTVERLAELSGVDLERLKAIIAGNRRMDGRTAEALGDTLGTSAVVWINLDMAYRKWRNRQMGL